MTNDAQRTDAERAEFDLMRFAFESKGSDIYKAWLIEVRDGDSYRPWDVVNDWINWQTAWQAARRAPAAPVPQGWRDLVKEARDNCMASIAEDGISHGRREYRKELLSRLDAMLSAAPQPPVAAPVELPEPAGWIDDGGMVFWHDGRKPNDGEIIYTEQQVRDLLVDQAKQGAKQ